MNKIVAYLVFLLIGIGIGYLLNNCEVKEPKEVHTINAQIDSKKQDIANRNPKEDQLRDSLKTIIKKVDKISKENIELTKIADVAVFKYKEAKKAIPLTHGDTIVFLMRDTLMCDSALLRSQDLVQGLTKEIVNDNKEIETLDSLNINLESDKRDLQKIDTLHQEKEKDLEKKVKKTFWGGFSWGALFLGAAELAWKLALFLL